MKPVEIWRPIEGASGYDVSDMGRVRSWKWPVRTPENKWIPRPQLGFRILKPDTRNGYLSVRIAFDELGIKTINIHILVLETFVGKRPDKMQGAHEDGDKKNNCLLNLKWKTPRDNNKDKIKHGTHLTGSSVGTSKLSDFDVKTIRREKSCGAKSGDLAKKYNVHRNTIWNITAKNTYKECKHD